MDDMLQDLAQHLAYHASVGFAECRDMDPPLEPTAEEWANRWPGHVEFIVEHAGRKFTVSIEEIV